jgi:hypothetical protein
MWKIITLLGIVLAIASSASPALAQNEIADANGEQMRVLNDRADKIVAPLGIEDAALATRVRDLIATQYHALSGIHDGRDAGKLTPEQVAAEQLSAHRQFVARLEAQLTPEQVNQVKDGITYGVVPITYRGYLELLPDLTDEQKLEIMANLLEAREYAMDAGSSREKHGWFGKFKGRINNYLSQAGYDLRQAEEARADRNK